MENSYHANETQSNSIKDQSKNPYSQGTSGRMPTPLCARVKDLYKSGGHAIIHRATRGVGNTDRLPSHAELTWEASPGPPEIQEPGLERNSIFSQLMFAGRVQLCSNRGELLGTGEFPCVQWLHRSYQCNKHVLNTVISLAEDSRPYLFGNKFWTFLSLLVRCNNNSERYAS